MAVKIIQISGAVPQRARGYCCVRETADAALDAILAWARSSLRGVVWWSQTRFSEPLAPHHRCCRDSRQKHFKDGYWVYRFWFSHKTAAALFILWWGRAIDLD